MNNMTHVVVFGTFDKVHKGHQYLLNQAKQLGDTLTVVIARDSTVLKVKGKSCLLNQEERKHFISLEPSVDAAVLGNQDDPYLIIETLKPNIIALGYDQNVFVDNLKQILIDRGVDAQIVRIASYLPKLYKSSIINYDKNSHRNSK